MANIKRKLIALLARKTFQPIYEKLHYVNLRLMNYGSANSPKESGEVYVLEYIKKKSKTVKKTIIFDLGANHGQYASAVYKIFGHENISYYGFEPGSLAYKSLRSSQLPSNYHFYKLGISSITAQQELFGALSGSVKASFHAKTDIGDTSSEIIETVTLDDFCTINNINSIDLLKIDVEGHELEVLKGANQLLEKNKIKYIQFEFGDMSRESRVFLRDFREILQNFILYRIVQDGWVKQPNKPSSEIFITTNYLAIRKDLIE